MKKVAIINRTNFINYGSLLQTFALSEIVKDFGFDSKILWEKGGLKSNSDFRLKKIIKTSFRLLFHPSLLKKNRSMLNSVSGRVISDNTVTLFKNFIDAFVNREYLSYRQLKIAAKKEYDKLICGSDQVWCSTSLYVDPLMYLRFAPKRKRVAYAPSLGRDYIPNYNKRIMKKYINDIPYVSVREEKGQELIKELTGVEVPVVLDPTLLFDKDRWNKYKISPTIDFNYVLCYFLDEPSKDIQERIKEYAVEKNLKIIALNVKLSFIDDAIYPDCGPQEFLGFIDSASCVITDSYHGMLFSINYGKDFISVERDYKEYDQSSRQKSILNLFNLFDRYVIDGQFPLVGVNYEKVYDKLNSEREKSLQYLEEALNGK